MSDVTVQNIWESSAALPYLTSDLPGTGGVLKSSADDFEVEEIPAYEPCGEGEHLFLWVEKQDTSAYELLRHITRILGIGPAEVGTAGLKDTRARTRQMVSVPAYVGGGVNALDTDKIRILRAEKHKNKLKTGHLHGNRFRVVVRGVSNDGVARAKAIAEQVVLRGVPNFYGEQRFGIDGETLAIGLALLKNEPFPSSIGRRPVRGHLRRLALSSVQSALFNTLLRRRMARGHLHQAMLGEVMEVCASGGKFVVEDLEREQRRFDAHEIVPAGPMFGPKMRAADGTAKLEEEALLAEAGLQMAHFTRQGKLLLGTRRPNLVWMHDLVIESHSDMDALVATFTLPSGAYATVVMREILKTDVATGAASETETNASDSALEDANDTDSAMQEELEA